MISLQCFTIHSGESGLVYKAYIKTSIGKELVAVKTGKGIEKFNCAATLTDLFLITAFFSKSDFERLAKEISTMLSFDHPNVMSLIGVCMDREMPLVIMPFMSKGSVLEFVRHNKEELTVGLILITT